MNKANLKKKSALLIIDMQNDFVLPGAPACVSDAYNTIDTVKELLDFFRLNKKPVFHVIREYRKDGSDVEITRHKNFMEDIKFVVANTEGSKIVEKLQAVEGEYVIVKNRFSAFMNTELDFILRRLEISTLAICGTQYPNCIRATAYDAVSYGYEVKVITDATSAENKQIAEANITDLTNIGIPCLTLKEYIASN
jgi:nicotinamidase-related amidase